jgi:predicted alpha/beta-hydrolase family hydrolase
MAEARASRFRVDEKIGEVSSLVLRPRGAKAVYVLAHGAGADMHHPFMEDIAQALAARQVATFRFQFPYTEAGRRAPDRQPKLVATVAAAVAAARRLRLPLFSGGKSMGGRMSSLAVAEGAVDGVEGLVFLGFPLHRPGGPDDARGQHLLKVRAPMLFLQGERDKLADLGHLRPLCKRLGRRVKLHVIPQGDHSFKVPKRTGKTPEDIIAELADVTSDWIDARLA